MDVVELYHNWDVYWSVILIGLIWMLTHIVVLLSVAKIIKAPSSLSQGSQANVGGAASAPIVASAFSPALAPVGVLLAVLAMPSERWEPLCAWSSCTPSPCRPDELKPMPHRRLFDGEVGFVFLHGSDHHGLAFFDADSVFFELFTFCGLLVSNRTSSMPSVRRISAATSNERASA